MAKLIKNWKELEGLESENYKIKLDYIGDDPVAGWIVPKEETVETSFENYFVHHVYLSTHTFYGPNYQESTEILQKYGFDIEIDNWDKDTPEQEINYKRKVDLRSSHKLTTNQRKIKEFKEKANRPDASDNDAKKLIRACGGDVDKAVSLILTR